MNLDIGISKLKELFFVVLNTFMFSIDIIYFDIDFKFQCSFM